MQNYERKHSFSYEWYKWEPRVKRARTKLLIGVRLERLKLFLEFSFMNKVRIVFFREIWHRQSSPSVLLGRDWIYSFKSRIDCVEYFDLLEWSLDGNFLVLRLLFAVARSCTPAELSTDHNNHWRALLAEITWMRLPKRMNDAHSAMLVSETGTEASDFSFDDLIFWFLLFFEHYFYRASCSVPAGGE